MSSINVKRIALLLSVLFLLPLVIASPGLDIIGNNISGVIELNNQIASTSTGSGNFTPILSGLTRGNILWYNGSDWKNLANPLTPMILANNGTGGLEWQFNPIPTTPSWGSTLIVGRITNGQNPFISSGDMIQWRDSGHYISANDSSTIITANKSIVLNASVTNAQNISATFYFGDGSQLSNLPSGSQISNASLNATYVPYSNAHSNINLARKNITNVSSYNVYQSGSNSVPFDIVGTGSDGVGDPTYGVGFFMTHNEQGNAQFVEGATYNIRNNPTTTACIRRVFYDIGASYTPSIDGALCSGTGRTWLTFGTDSTGITVGSGLAYNGAGRAKVSIVSHAGVMGIGLYDAIYPSASGVRWEVNNTGYETVYATNLTELKFNTMTLKTCDGSQTNGTVSRNNSGLYFCDGTLWNRLY